MFLSKHRLNIAPLRIGKHRIAEKSEHRPSLSEGDWVLLNNPLKLEQWQSCLQQQNSNVVLDHLRHLTTKTNYARSQLGFSNKGRVRPSN